MIKYERLTREIIKCFYEVYNELGSGFLESIYQNALYIVLNEHGLSSEKQYPLCVYFRKRMIGEFRVDLIIEEKILIEVKAVSNLRKEHTAQIINYLKATDIEVGLLMNFGDKPIFKRFIFDQKRKSPS